MTRHLTVHARDLAGMLDTMGHLQSADFVLGFDAQWCGQPVSSCPHDRLFDHERWLEWRRGWMCGLSMEDGSRVHYDDGELVRPTRGMMELADSLPDDLVGHKGEVSFDTGLMFKPLPPFPGSLPTDDKPNGFKPPGQTWRDDRSDPPESDWDKESWKDGPKP